MIKYKPFTETFLYNKLMKFKEESSNTSRFNLYYEDINGGESTLLLAVDTDTLVEYLNPRISDEYNITRNEITTYDSYGEDECLYRIELVGGSLSKLLQSENENRNQVLVYE